MNYENVIWRYRVLWIDFKFSKNVSRKTNFNINRHFISHGLVESMIFYKFTESVSFILFVTCLCKVSGERFFIIFNINGPNMSKNNENEKHEIFEEWKIVLYAREASESWIRSGLIIQRFILVTVQFGIPPLFRPMLFSLRSNLSTIDDS